MKTLREHQQSQLEKQAIQDLHDAIDAMNKRTKCEQLNDLWSNSYANRLQFDEDGIELFNSPLPWD